MILLIESNMRGGISSVMGDRDVTSDENKKILYVDANNLYGDSMCQIYLMMKLSLIRMLY